MSATRASVALSKALQNNRSLRRRLAFACDVSEQAVRNWATGASVPKEQHRPTIERETGVKADGWLQVERPRKAA
jgi:hypothetical protein